MVGDTCCWVHHCILFLYHYIYIYIHIHIIADSTYRIRIIMQQSWSYRTCSKCVRIRGHIGVHLVGSSFMFVFFFTGSRMTGCLPSQIFLRKMLGITAGQVWSLNHTSRHPTWRLGLSLDSNYGCLSRCFTLKLEAPFISKISTKEGNATTWSFESWSSKFWTTSNRSNSKSMRIVPAVLGQLGSNLWIMETSHCECQGQFPIWQMSPWSPSIQ